MLGFLEILSFTFKNLCISFFFERQKDTQTEAGKESSQPLVNSPRRLHWPEWGPAGTRAKARKPSLPHEWEGCKCLAQLLPLEGCGKPEWGAGRGFKPSLFSEGRAHLHYHTTRPPLLCFVRDGHAVLHSNDTVLYSHQYCNKVPFLHILARVSFSFF